MRTPAKILSILGGAALGGLTAWKAYRDTSNFTIKRITVPLLPPDVAEEVGNFRILHISDLHMLPGQDRKIQWLNSLALAKPDLVVNTGDNLGDAAAVPHVLRALDPLLKYPGVFVFGSNDYFGPKPVNPFGYLLGKKRKVSNQALPWEGMRAAFKEHGWHDATHQRIEFKASGVRLAIAGVDDPHHDLDNYDLIAGAPNIDADLSIGLAHSPEPRVLERFAADGYQLSLHGHTHGGQICLPGGYTIVTNCGIDRRRAHGLHKFNNMWMHVSNGLGTSKYAPFRLFCRPSATIIDIR
ncbi:metallophosphoesterase [Corynebacterium sp.]|uniref:metallophosphoesterase n=1 Tax=Corynebacterium sp. TaxID=1720 RepID=UPI0026DB2BA2|nr:metallophosphoesterase [Corynebacterium sp.]MDO5077756.1 metallophosphoesterase [Corynebacterium sp.]